MVGKLWANVAKNLSSAYAWSFFFVAFLGMLGGVLTGGIADAGTRESIPFSFGGPVGEERPMETGEGTLRVAGGAEDSFLGDLPVQNAEDGALRGVSSPVSSVLAERNGIKIYKVQKGDTLSGVAAGFGVSLGTLKWANPELRSALRTGDILTIPPVDGVIYEVHSGDSLESVAGKFRTEASLIIKYNPGHQKLFDISGSKIVLPYAKPLAYIAEKHLPTLERYFALPARGWNWGTIHFDNAVDIADNCGSPIYASAEGLVIEVSAEGYWNEGYGNFVVLEHPNGTRTKYAHIEESLVKIGDYVAQGDKVASIGNTGKTHGPTGCHLHFEVLGAENPFAIR